MQNNLFCRSIQNYTTGTLNGCRGFCVTDNCENHYCHSGYTKRNNAHVHPERIWGPHHTQKRHYTAEKDTQRLKLMDFDEIMFPSLIKWNKNIIFKMLLRTFDNKFTTAAFLEGVKQV